MKLGACVILCGGRSSRMGRDKTGLPFGKFPALWQYQVAKMSEIFSEIYISLKEQKAREIAINLGEDFEPQNSDKIYKFSAPNSDKIYEFKFIIDADENFSPMGALAKILSIFSPNQNIFIIACDMPFIALSTIEILRANMNEKIQISLPCDDNHTHRLCGFYNSNLAKNALNLYTENSHKIGALSQPQYTKIIKFNSADEFANLNTPNEYQTALQKLN